MLVAIHQLAQTYGYLPSEVLERASTFDLMVMDTFLDYKNKEINKQKGSLPDPSSYATDELLEIWERFKGVKA